MRALQLALTVLVTWLILDRVGLGFDQLAAVERSAWIPDPLLAGAASALLLGAYFVSAALWGLVVRELGGPRLPTMVSAEIVLVSNLGRYIPGKVWQIAGLVVLAKGRGVPPGTAAAAGVLGQGVSLVAAGTLGLGTLLASPEPYRTWGVAGAVVVAAAAVIGSVPAVFGRAVRTLVRVTGAERPEALGPLRVLKWLALYAFNWAAYALSFLLLARSLDLPGEPLAVASAFTAAYVLGYAMIFAPAGLGPREGFLIAFLTPHMGAAPAGVIAIVSRIWMTLVELVPAGAFWVAHVARGPRKGSRGGAEGGGRA